MKNGLVIVGALLVGLAHAAEPDDEGGQCRRDYDPEVEAAVQNAPALALVEKGGEAGEAPVKAPDCASDAGATTRPPAPDAPVPPASRCAPVSR